MKRTKRNEILNSLTGKSILALILTAFLSISAFADGAIWATQMGEIEYMKHTGTTAVFSNEKPGINPVTWFYINDIDQSLPDRGSYSGYWIDNSGRQMCEASLVDPNGTKSRNWGRLEITFEEDGSYPIWTGTLGDCFKQPDSVLKATKPRDSVESSPESGSAVQTNYLITTNSVGDMRTGMTVFEARRVLKGSIFKQTPCLIEVTLGNEIIMKLGTPLEFMKTEADGVEDYDETEEYCTGKAPPINEFARIESIEVFDSRYRTKAGVHAKMKISDAEKIYGQVRFVLPPDGPGDEQTFFANQPMDFLFTSEPGGMYGDESDETNRYQPWAVINSIAIYGSVDE